MQPVSKSERTSSKPSLPVVPEKRHNLTSRSVSQALPNAEISSSSQLPKKVKIEKPQESSIAQKIVNNFFAIPIDKSNLSARNEIKDLMDFLKSSPTAFHTGATARRLCVELNGFKELQENEKWDLVPGGKYFVARDVSSFIAFVLPKQTPERACILGGHTDSPGLKLKPNPEKTADNVSLLCPEVYGGAITPSWMGRSLGLAGRITYSDDNQNIKSTLIDFGKTIGSIPYVAIHLERTQKEKVEINLQDHLPAICWLQTGEGSPKPHLEEELKNIVPFSKLLSHELFFIPREAPEIVNDQFIHSPKLDNLLGVHASLYALVNSTPPENQVKMVACWDHEEIGSNSVKGAASNFLDTVIERICDKTKMTPESSAVFKANSSLISIDVAHGRHPNYSGKHEPNHAPQLGKGPVIKYHANQSYATNDRTAAWIYNAGSIANIPIQKFCVRSDAICGSTIGNIVAPRLGIPTVDIGAPIWEMHAIKEMGSLLDHIYMCRLLQTLFSMDL